MKKKKTLRIAEALDFIENNLDRDFSLRTVSDIAGFSLFYFHRIFSFSVGYTLAEYIRKRRLSEVSFDLTKTNRRIIDIALDYHFESQESFSRAFKKEFKVTPAYYRRKKPNIPQLLPAKMEIPKHIGKGELTMEPTIKEIGELKLVGIKHFGTDKDIPEVWMKMDPFYNKIKHTAKPDVGIEYSWDESDEHKDNYWFMVSCLVDKLQDIPDGLETTIIPAQKYAVFTHKGTIFTIGRTFKYIYNEWLPNSDLECSGRYNLQWYDDRFTKKGKMGQSEDSEVDILIPVK
jgi:AraC family transcriptional regulator